MTGLVPLGEEEDGPWFSLCHVRTARRRPARKEASQEEGSHCTCWDLDFGLAAIGAVGNSPPWACPVLPCGGLGSGPWPEVTAWGLLSRRVSVTRGPEMSLRPPLGLPALLPHPR